MVNSTDRSPVTQVTGDKLHLSIVTPQVAGRLEGNVIVGDTMEAIPANTVFLVELVGEPVEVGMRRGYYSDNKEDAILMTAEDIKSELFQARFQQLKKSHSQKIKGYLKQASSTAEYG